jgi:GTP cyclohydrolase FolE2
MIQYLKSKQIIPLTKPPIYTREVNSAFEFLLEEYCSESSDIIESIDRIDLLKNKLTPDFDVKEEENAVTSFLNTPCPCSKNCQQQLSRDEVISNRAFFRSLEKMERRVPLCQI